jgi:DNA repair protein RadC
VYQIPAVRVALVQERTIASALQAVRSPEDAAAVLREVIGDYDRETFAVLLLDTKNRLIAVHIASIGLLDSAPVHPREIFKAAILANARAVILGHNHPSGDPQPSAQDIRVTRLLAEAGRLLEIRVLDHIIVGDGTHVSLRARGEPL